MSSHEVQHPHLLSLGSALVSNQVISFLVTKLLQSEWEWE